MTNLVATMDAVTATFLMVLVLGLSIGLGTALVAAGAGRLAATRLDRALSSNPVRVLSGTATITNLDAIDQLPDLCALFDSAPATTSAGIRFPRDRSRPAPMRAPDLGPVGSRPMMAVGQWAAHAQERDSVHGRIPFSADRLYRARAAYLAKCGRA